MSCEHELIDNDSIPVAWMKMIASELYILSHGALGSLPDGVPEVEDLIQGRYGEVLKTEAAQAIFNLGKVEAIAEEGIVAAIKKNVHEFITGTSDDSGQQHRCIQTLCVGIACFDLFVRNNWTGPPSDVTPKHVLPEAWMEETRAAELADCVSGALNQLDASIYPLSTHPIFLFLAECVLVDSSEALSSLATLDWWSLRCLWFHQVILDDRSPEIHLKIKSRLENVVRQESLMSVERSGYLPILFHLECVHIHQYYYQYSEAQEHLQTAKKMTGLEVAFTGALGKRTRFQREDKSQLLLKIDKSHEDSNSGSLEPEAIPGLPKDLMLDDDTVLNDIKYREEGIDEIPLLSGVEQVLLIALCLEHKRKSPKDDLVNQELYAYVVSVLKQPQFWAIQTRALSLRCLLEKDKRRKVERAMMQMQAVVDGFKDPTCPIHQRMKFVCSTNLNPRWVMEKELASLLIDLGSISSALEIFHRLELWEDVIACYKRLGKPEKAAKVIRDQLAVKESVLMLCLLGDVTEKKEHYERAWELSEHKSSRAQRSLGMHYLREADFDRCIECLETSLQINYLQYNAWFVLGFAALEAKKYETAARAYRQSVLIESDNFEAWNNLANAYTRLNHKDKAFRAFKEAIKCNYDHWKVWENYLVISMDVGQFSEAIRAYQRLLELKEKFIDEEILRIMAGIVTKNIPDFAGKPGVEFKEKIAKLFGHLTSQISTNARVWELYAQVHGNGQSDDQESNSKAIQFLQRAHRLQTQGKDWYKGGAEITKVIQLTNLLTEGYMKYSTMASTTAEAIQTLSSAKLMLKGIIAKAKQASEDLPETWQGHQADLADLEKRLEAVQASITERKGGAG